MARKLPVLRQLATLWDAVYTIRDALFWVGGTSETSSRAAASQLGETLLASPRHRDTRKLNHSELQVFSQGGEDGIIAEVFRRIGATSRRFVEFGVEDGLETNTTYLLSLGDWAGTWIEGSPEHVARAKEGFRDAIAGGRLDVRHAFVTAENAARLLRDAEIPEEFDLLSLDIDRNTYYLWSALSAYRPRVVVVEYNASIPSSDEWKVEYAADKMWNGTVHYGASLKSFELLGRRLGYSLVGCGLNGVNAFFVRDDLVGDHFASPFTAENHHEPPRYWLQWRSGHPRGLAD